MSAPTDPDLKDSSSTSARFYSFRICTFSPSVPEIEQTALKKPIRVLLGFGNKVVGVVPVCQQVCGLLIVHTHIEIREHPREEVVNFSGNIQDVAHPATKTITCQLFSLSCIYLPLCQHTVCRHKSNKFTKELHHPRSQNV